MSRDTWIWHSTIPRLLLHGPCFRPFSNIIPGPWMSTILSEHNGSENPWISTSARGWISWFLQSVLQSRLASRGPNTSSRYSTAASPPKYLIGLRVWTAKHVRRGKFPYSGLGTAACLWPMRSGPIQASHCIFQCYTRLWSFVILLGRITRFDAHISWW